jgi:pimeloyl-ACP methyl ester carboxylesterase
VDGLFPSEPAADVAHVYPPPYYSFWKGNSVASIRESHRWLHQKLNEDGPYDGVMLFSQGCGLISSYLLYHQAMNGMGTTSPPSFKVAIFICGGVALSVLQDLGVEVGREAHDWDRRTSLQLQKKNTASEVLGWGPDRWTHRAEDCIFDPDQPVDLRNVFGLNVLDIPAHLRIRIPTVHIYGSRDPRYPASLQLAHLCDGAIRRSFDHGGGHDVPRSKDASEAIARLLIWSAQKAKEPQSE